MTISRPEAEQSLAAIQAAGQESSQRSAYRHAAPYIVGWGIVWALGYGAMTVLPVATANVVWLILLLAMIGFSAVLMRRQSESKLSWGRIALYIVVPVVASIIVVNLIANGLALQSRTEISALFVFVVAAGYAISALKYGRWYAPLGLGLAAITALGLWLLPPGLKFDIFYFDAACLLLGGFWFRRA